MPRIKITFHGHLITSPELNEKEVGEQAKSLGEAIADPTKTAVLPWGAFRGESLNSFHIESDESPAS